MSRAGEPIRFTPYTERGLSYPLGAAKLGGRPHARSLSPTVPVGTVPAGTRGVPLAHLTAHKKAPFPTTERGFPLPRCNGRPKGRPYINGGHAPQHSHLLGRLRSPLELCRHSLHAPQHDVEMDVAFLPPQERAATGMTSLWASKPVCAYKPKLIRFALIAFVNLKGIERV